MRNVLTLGSLFDGIGGFPLAAVREGILPVWASEIEAAPISITKRHFPDMRHLGDITKISGAEIEPVDVITFGSPCQDLSISGKRVGLDGDRSGLFLQAIRIVNGRGFKEDVSYTLNTVDRHAVAVPFVSSGFEYAVRRLTPLECERLQGFPDGWTEFGHDGKLISDTQRYMALGNSVAIPCVQYILSDLVN
jgi:site-specific DNA-cytosine methylase